MIRQLTPLTLVALMAATAPALAQDTTATGDAAAPTTEEAAQPPAQEAAPETGGAQLDLGQPADGSTPELGQRYSKEKFGDWDLACIKTEAEKDPCSLLQILTDETGNAVAEVSMFRIDNGGQAVAGATVIVPLETLLPGQLTIAVDGGAGKRYNYAFCNPIGCIAQIGLTADDIAAFKKGKAATVSLVPAPAPDQRITLNMSLNGFTAGFEAVDVLTR